MIITEHERPSHLIAHFSDTHLTGDGSLLGGVVDAHGHLRALLAALEGTAAPIDALVFTGDLADRGEPGAYAALADIVLPAAERMGARVIWAMGNHDQRAAFRAGLLDEPSSDGPASDGPASDAPVLKVDDVRGLRIVTCDSTVPGRSHGIVDAEQLAWLREVLAEPAPHGTLLLMHHPPLPTVLDQAVTVELRDQASLAQALAGTDVRAILSGHVHHPAFGLFGSVPVSVASSIGYAQDLTVPFGGMRGQDALQSYSLVQVHASTIVHSPVALAGPALVGKPWAPDESAASIEREGIVWRERA